MPTAINFENSHAYNNLGSYGYTEHESKYLGAQTSILQTLPYIHVSEIFFKAKRRLLKYLKKSNYYCLLHGLNFMKSG